MERNQACEHAKEHVALYYRENTYMYICIYVYINGSHTISHTVLFSRKQTLFPIQTASISDEAL